VKINEFKEFLSSIIEKRQSGVLKAYRRAFGDPLLYAYFLKGVPVYASSFVVREKWYEGLLSREEVDQNIFGNIFKYAYDKHGKRFLEHLVSYSRNVIKEVLRAVAENGWEVEAEFLERPESHIKESIGITSRTTVENWAKTLLSIGATSVYIPRRDRVLGMVRGDNIKRLYAVLRRNFGDSDVIYSTPFANAFLIHRLGEPVLVVADFMMGFEEIENFKHLLKSTEPVVYEGTLEPGRKMDFPVLDGIGKPFAVALRKDKNRYDLAVIRDDRVAYLYPMDVEKVFATIVDLAEKSSAVLYRILDKIDEGRGIPQRVMDMHIRILMMMHPHPEDLYKVAMEKFGIGGAT